MESDLRSPTRQFSGSRCCGSVMSVGMKGEESVWETYRPWSEIAVYPRSSQCSTFLSCILGVVWRDVNTFIVSCVLTEQDTGPSDLCK